MSIAGVISSLAHATYTVTRTARSTIDLGRKIVGATTTFDIIAGSQPSNGPALRVLADARHLEDVLVIYTVTELYNLRAAFEPDKILIDGDLYEIFKVERWPSHWRAYAGRMVQQ